MVQDSRPHDTRRAELRSRVNRHRAERCTAQRTDDDRARTTLALDLIASLCEPGSTIACYLSTGCEPSTMGLIARLLGTHKLLVPYLHRPPGARGVPFPDWARLHDLAELTEGPFAIPAPPPPGLGASSLGHASVVIAAALMAGADGSRLGTGGGWYDRALRFAAPRTPVVVLLNDDEVACCPMASHDIPIEWIVTPTNVIRTTS